MCFDFFDFFTIFICLGENILRGSTKADYEVEIANSLICPNLDFDWREDEITCESKQYFSIFVTLMWPVYHDKVPNRKSTVNLHPIYPKLFSRRLNLD